MADGDAGDKYNGLDRFGRVADQRWLDGSGADRLKYGYDAGSNPIVSNLYSALGGRVLSVQLVPSTHRRPRPQRRAQVPPESSIRRSRSPDRGRIRAA